MLRYKDYPNVFIDDGDSSLASPTASRGLPPPLGTKTAYNQKQAEKVRGIIETVDSSGTGGALCMLIKGLPHTLLVTGPTAFCISEARFNWSKPSLGTLATLGGDPIDPADPKGLRGAPDDPADPHFVVKGVDVELRLDPDNVGNSETCQAISKSGSPADEILCHELFHAYSYMSGLSRHHRIDVNVRLRGSLHGQEIYQTENTNWEETVAILVGNIYASEPGHRGKLRSFDHSDMAELSPADAAAFGRINKPFLQELKRCQFRLWSVLEKVNAKFNPIRDYR